MSTSSASKLSKRSVAILGWRTLRPFVDEIDYLLAHPRNGFKYAMCSPELPPPEFGVAEFRSFPYRTRAFDHFHRSPAESLGGRSAHTMPRPGTSIRSPPTNKALLVAESAARPARMG